MISSDPSVAMRGGGPTRVVMVTEGTYPHAQGGVSVWCDQVVRGLSDIEFEVVALTAFGDEQVAWELPANVANVQTLGLWGPAGPRAGAGERWQSVRAMKALGRILEASAVDPRSPNLGTMPAGRDLDEAWAILCDPRIASLLPRLVGSENFMQLIIDVWNAARLGGYVSRSQTISVAHAVVISEHLSHSLRPLGAETPHADLYHAVSNGLATLPCIAAHFRHTTPFVVSEHGVYLRERLLAGTNTELAFPVRAFLMGFVRELVSLAYRTASVVAPGNQYNKSWQIRLGADPDRIVTTYNGVDPAGFPPAPPEPRDPTLTFVGRIDPLKDLETLVRAFALVRLEIPDARLRVFGATPKGNEAYHETCVTLAKELGVGDGVSWEGRVPDISEAYGTGSIIVLSSISEGFPYTVIEGMCRGRPIVATDVGGVSEAVGDAGIVVRPRDPQAFADACVTLLRDGETRREMGARARARVLGNFTLDAAVAAVRGAYQSAYASPRHTRWQEKPQLAPDVPQPQPVPFVEAAR